MNTQELSEELTSSPVAKYVWLQIRLYSISFNLPCVILLCVSEVSTPIRGAFRLHVHLLMDQLCRWYVQGCHGCHRPDCHGRHLRLSADPVPGRGLVHELWPHKTKVGSPQGLGASDQQATGLTAILNFVCGSLFRQTRCLYIMPFWLCGLYSVVCRAPHSVSPLLFWAGGWAFRDQSQKAQLQEKILIPLHRMLPV